MSEKEVLSTEPYKGVRDFYPKDFAMLSSIFDTLRKTLRLYGYEEYGASPLERTELYTSKTSQEIVNEQTYTFTDRGERSVTLRPEMTPTFARMVAGKRHDLTFPLRWFSLPNLFRYERPQRGRLREHYQLNVDSAGLPAEHADVEIITVASSIMRAFGASDSDFKISINSRELLSAACEAAQLSPEDTRAYMRLLDKKNKMSTDDFNNEVQKITSEEPLILIDNNDARITIQKNVLTNMIASLSTRGITNVVFDPSITRGFDYYTGMVFEVFDTSPENTRSMFGGGRYDNLSTLFGGEPIPCIGFGMGDVTLIDFLESHGYAPTVSIAPDVYIGVPTPEDIPRAQVLAQNLRTQDISVIIHMSGKALGDQIKDASKRGIPYFLIYGADEHIQDIVQIKNLSTGVQEAVSLAAIQDFIAK